MKKNKKFIPYLIDFAVIAAYVSGFYGIYYRMPRQLESSSITAISANNSSSQIDESIYNTEHSENDTSEITSISTENSASNTSISSESTTSNNITAASEKNDNLIETTTAEAATENVTTNLYEKFADKFTDNVVITDSSYSSNDISISINKYSTGSGRDMITYYVADIYVADIKSIQCALADNTYGVGYTDTVGNMSSEIGAILAMNGDYYGNGSDGVVIRNGVVYRSDTDGSDVCVLYSDGTMETYSAEEFDVNEAIQNGAWQAWSFGPELLDNGNLKTSDFQTSGNVSGRNPRSAIGYYEPGHYCMVVVDGRQRNYSQGVKLDELSEIFCNLGCTAAYNLDGGKSSVMDFNGSTVNSPVDGGRKVSDIVAVVETN